MVHFERNAYQKYKRENFYVEYRLRHVIDECIPYYEILKLQADSEIDSSPL